MIRRQFGLVLTVLWLSAGTVAAQTTPSTLTPGTPVDRITATTANDRLCSTLTTDPVTIPGTTVRFTQHLRGTDPQAVVVTFDATWPQPLSTDMPPDTFIAGATVSLLIDGKISDPISQGGGALISDFASNGSHGFRFVTDPVAAGDHIATISYSAGIVKLPASSAPSNTGKCSLKDIDCVVGSNNCKFNCGVEDVESGGLNFGFCDGNPNKRCKPDTAATDCASPENGAGTPQSCIYQCPEVVGSEKCDPTDPNACQFGTCEAYGPPLTGVVCIKDSHDCS